MPHFVEYLDNQHRLLIMLAALMLFVDMGIPAILIVNDPGGAWTSIVASMTTVPMIVGGAFSFAAVAMLPMIFFLGSNCCSRKTFKLACAGACAGSTASLCLSYLSRHLDIGWFSLLYFANGVIALLFAAALAIFLNDRQVEPYEEPGANS